MTGERQGTFFFTLEYCDSGSVEHLRKERGGTLPIDEACAIIFQALTGLEYTHQAEIPQVRLADGSYGPGRGLVHRDLKPQNLLLSGSGSSRRVKISDYGLSKAFDLAGLSGLTRSDMPVGTPAFVPRQQVVNFKYAKPEVDIWALAATLSYLLTGAAPRDFDGRYPWLVVLETSAKPIRKRNPQIPARLAHVIDQALVDKPQIHFKTATEFRRALEEGL
jgi:serine/threonine protein kinase